jgi:hypothetical protein
LPGLFLLPATLPNPELDAVEADAGQLAALSRLKAELDWLRADIFPTTARPRVDRINGIIYGRVLAEKGQFKTKRGEFDDKSLDLIHGLATEHANGLKARFTHPALSSDGLGKFLGRDRNIRRDGDRVLGDLYLDRTALRPPPGGGRPLGEYVMDLAESDPAALGSSLVLKADKEARLNSDGTAAKDDKGNALPPVWRPTKLHACDVVDDGDAVHGAFLSADLPDHVVREVAAALDSQFRDCDRATVESRGRAFLSRYLDLRFGDDDMSTANPPANPNGPADTPPQNPPANPPAGPPANPATPPADPPPDKAVQDRLSAYDRRLAELEAERERERLATRSRTVDALFDKWENRRDPATGRPDPQVTPEEAKKDAPGNLRAVMLAADATTFDALSAMTDARPAGLYRGFFAEKIKQPGAGADLPEVAAAKKYAERENARTAKR